MATKALAIDPLAPPVMVGAAWAALLQGQCDEADRIRQRALSIAPDAGRLHYISAMCLILFRDDAVKALPLLHREPVAFARESGLAIALKRLGREQEAQAALEKMRAQYGELAAYQYAQVHAQWGNPDRAVEWLRRAYETRDPGFVNVFSDPAFQPLADNTDFQTVIRLWRRETGLLEN